MRLRSVVEASHDGETDGEAHRPAGQDSQVGGGGVVTVLAVDDGRGHRKEPVTL